MKFFFSTLLFPVIFFKITTFILIFPFDGNKSLHKISAKVDFPEPDFPVIHIFCQYENQDAS